MKNKLNNFITGSLLAILLAGGFASAQTATPTVEVTGSDSPVVSTWDGGDRGYGMMGDWENGRNGRGYGENGSWRNMMPAFAAGFIGLGVFVGIIGLILVAFWVWMLVHAASSDIKHKPLWLLVIWFMNIVGAIIYFFVIKRQYDAEMKECGCESCACDDNEKTCACGKNEKCQCDQETHE
ncbi:MAG: PLDc protein [Patescibacteria group bacterium]|nr:PLDc protein [Patescibacteria group bacterium]